MIEINNKLKCRHCEQTLKTPFIDLGSAPPSNAYIPQNKKSKPEIWYELKTWVCDNCFLVQTGYSPSGEELFTADYAYFSSYSKTWLNHCENYANKIIKELDLNNSSQVIEIASNDGYLLQFFIKNKIPSLGIEPTKSTATAAREKGVETREIFFNSLNAEKLKNEGYKADLIIANNVLAHVPNINDFIKSFAILLKEEGAISFEFPHILRLIESNQFDTIYHEHYFYISLFSIKRIFEKFDLQIYKIDEIPTHGGSLRVYLSHKKAAFKIDGSVLKVLNDELNAGIDEIEFYRNQQIKFDNIRDDFLSFLMKAKKEGKSVAGYGAAAKANSILNYAGVKSIDNNMGYINFIVDKNPAKQGQYMPGSKIKIVGEDYLINEKPDYIIIFPWNLSDEIKAQLSYAKSWGAKFVTLIPNLQIGEL